MNNGKIYIVRKFLVAHSVADAIKKEKNIAPDEVMIIGDKHIEVLEQSLIKQPGYGNAIQKSSAEEVLPRKQSKVRKGGGRC